MIFFGFHTMGNNPKPEVALDQSLHKSSNSHHEKTTRLQHRPSGTRTIFRTQDRISFPFAPGYWYLVEELVAVLGSSRAADINHLCGKQIDHENIEQKQQITLVSPGVGGIRALGVACDLKRPEQPGP
jgi:hypothetical protein